MPLARPEPHKPRQGGVLAPVAVAVASALGRAAEKLPLVAATTRKTSSRLARAEKKPSKLARVVKKPSKLAARANRPAQAAKPPASRAWTLQLGAAAQLAHRVSKQAKVAPPARLRVFPAA